MAFVNERSEIPGESRAVDYERGAVLKVDGVENLNRTPRVETGFHIVWKEKKIEILAVQKVEVFKPDGSEACVTYFVNKCHYPDELRSYKQEIIQLVVDGLMTYGFNFGKDPGTEIVVRINPALGNLQMEPLHELPPSPEISKNIH